MPAPDWAQKMLCVLLGPIGEQFLLSSFREFVHDGYCLDHGLSGSCTKEMHAGRKLSVWYKIPIWFQNIVCPKTKEAFPKVQAWAYSATGIHACIFGQASCVNRYHDGWQPQKRRMEKWIHIFSFFIVIIPIRLLCQMQELTLLELNCY